MIFTLSTDDRCLTAFPTIADATSYCEGIDVEDGIWLFFASDGRCLKPRFTQPNSRGIFSVASGHYVLEPDRDGSHLQEQLAKVVSVDGCGLTSVDDVRKLLGGAK